ADGWSEAPRQTIPYGINSTERAARKTRTGLHAILRRRSFGSAQQSFIHGSVSEHRGAAIARVAAEARRGQSLARERPASFRGAYSNAGSSTGAGGLATRSL